MRSTRRMHSKLSQLLQKSQSLCKSSFKGDQLEQRIHLGSKSRLMRSLRETLILNMLTFAKLKPKKYSKLAQKLASLGLTLQI